MNEFVIYFLKSSGVLALFLSVYYLFLRKETLFEENRFFLLGGLLISLFIPFFVITKYIEVPIVTHTIEGMFVSAENTVIAEPEISWITILGYIYMAGVAFFFLRFLISLCSLFALLWKSKVTKKDKRFVYVETNASFSPFSFFNYIVYNPSLYSSEELQVIIKHEQAHSSQLHSLDVFAAKLYCIFMWFNPLAWLHKKCIFQNLEFLADRAAIKQTASKKAYQLTLLKVSGNTFCPALTNNFYNSLIKKRIVMLQKTQSKHFNRWKQVVILPLLVVFVFAFNTKVIAKEVNTSIPVTQDISKNEVIGDLVVVITKNTSIDELKAYKKLFSSQDIKFKYSDVDFNKKGEIRKISLELSSKNNQKANATFNNKGDNAIADIQLGKRDSGLFIESNSFTKKHENVYAYSVTSDNDKPSKKVIVKSINGNKADVNTWVYEKDAKTVDIRKEGDKEVIIVNGKKLEPETIIEEEIEIKNDDGKEFIIINNGKNNKDKEIEVEVIEEKANKIVFRNSNNEKPLIIIDGKIANDEKMNALDADEIETVSVLKGESATEKYGKKAKDGVIEITTKKKN